MTLSAVVIRYEKSRASSPWEEDVGVYLGCFQLEGNVFLTLGTRRGKKRKKTAFLEPK